MNTCKVKISAVIKFSLPIQYESQKSMSSYNSPNTNGFNSVFS